VEVPVSTQRLLPVRKLRCNKLLWMCFVREREPRVKCSEETWAFPAFNQWSIVVGVPQGEI
jgi:hypothetical protein